MALISSMIFAVDKEVSPVFSDLCLRIQDHDRHLAFKRYLTLSQFQCQRVFMNGFEESGSEQVMHLHRSADDRSGEFFIEHSSLHRS